MTVSADYAPHSFSPGDALAAEGIPWEFLDAAHLIVTNTADEDGTITLLVEGDDYSIGGDGPGGTGTITPASAWPAGDVWTIERETPADQRVQIPAHEPLPGPEAERQLDRMALAAQESKARVGALGDGSFDRALMVPAGATAPVADFPDEREGKVLIFRDGKISAEIGETPEDVAPAILDAFTTGASPRSQAAKNLDTVNLLDFKADADADFTNSLIRFNRWARAESIAGRGVSLDLPPRSIEYDHSKCFGFLEGIRRLRIRGYGARLQNIYASSGGYSYAWGNASRAVVYTDGSGYQGSVSALIDTVAQQATSVTCTTAADAGDFAIGDDVLIAGLDVQYFGYPINPQFHDFARVTSVNPGTGAIGIDRALKYGYRSDWPDPPAGVGISPIGKARIIRLTGAVWEGASPDNGFGTDLLCYQDGDLSPFDTWHVYEGLDIGRAPHASSQPYILTSGEKAVWIECNIPGTCETVIRDHAFRGGRIFDDSEPDKIVGRTLYDHVDIKKSLIFQSVSVEHAIVRNCRVGGVLSGGMVKYFTVEGGRAGSVQIKNGGGQYGLPSRHRLSNVQSDYRGGQFDAQPLGVGTGPAAVDGTIVAYAAGRISLRKADAPMYALNPVPGGKIAIYGAAGLVRPGIGIIRALSDDATHYHVDTTLPHATLPGWATHVGVLNNPELIVENCSGSHGLRQYSEACKKGKTPGSYRRWMVSGRNAAAATLFTSNGLLERIRVNVIQAAGVAISNPRLTVTISTDNADAVNDTKSLIFVYDLAVAGVRDYDAAALGGKTSNDTADLQTTDLTVLPIDRWCRSSATFGFSYTPSAQAYADLPVVEIEIWWDRGLADTVLPSLFDDNTFATVLDLTVPQLP